LYSANELIELIGKSERNENILKLLSNVGQLKPLKRPKRGESGVYVECQEKGIQILFTLAEEFSEEISKKYMEGELILDTIFFTPTDDPNASILMSLPKGLSYSTNRSSAREMLGQPNWIGKGINNDRWHFQNIRMLVSFSADESFIETISIGLDN
jgi:hypothetical protein